MRFAFAGCAWIPATQTHPITVATATIQRFMVALLALATESQSQPPSRSALRRARQRQANTNTRLRLLQDFAVPRDEPASKAIDSTTRRDAARYPGPAPCVFT